MFNYLDGGLNLNRSKESLNIKGCDDFTWFQPFALELLDKVLSVFEVVWGLVYQGFDDVRKLLGNPICDGPPTGNNGSEGGAYFVDFREAIELGGTALVG